MDVTIVIPVKNGGKVLLGVLKQISRQITKYNFEVICIDSGSQDNSIEIIKQFSMCNLYQISPSEFGHGKTRNFGASKGSGEYIMFITQDAVPYDEYWIENFINSMASDNKIVGGFGKHHPYPDCNVLDARDITMMFSNFGSEDVIYQITDQERYKQDEGYRHLLAFYSDNNSCMRRDIWKKYPYPDVNFAEDQLWAKSMIEKGFKKLYCPSAGVYHSHNYKLLTYFSRYYDEYKGLYELHKYQIATTRRSMLKRCLYNIYSDFNYIRTLKIKKKDKLKWMWYAFIRNQCRYYAGFIAGKYHTYSTKKQQRLDRRYSQQYKQIKQ